MDSVPYLLAVGNAWPLWVLVKAHFSSGEQLLFPSSPAEEEDQTEGRIYPPEFLRQESLVLPGGDTFRARLPCILRALDSLPPGSWGAVEVGKCCHLVTSATPALKCSLKNHSRDPGLALVSCLSLNKLLNLSVPHL